MKKEQLFVLLIAVALHCCSGITVPGFCIPSEHILAGSPFSFQDDDTEDGMPNTNCSFWSRTANGSMQQNGQDWMLDELELQYTFLKAGDYSYNCGDTDVMGNFTVVPTIHSLSLCQGCDPTLTVATGDSVKWVVVPDHDSGPIDCTVRLVDDMKDTTIRELFMDVNQYQFQDPGRFKLLCLEEEDISATITVSTQVKPPDTTQLLPLLYTHVALMAVAFGFLFPLAAFLYYHRISLAYKLLFPVALLLAVCGLVIVLVYVELTADKSHFGYPIHGVVGVALVALVVVVMPLLLLHRKSRAYHFRLGHAVAFFGMGNILLGLTILPVTFTIGVTLCAIYGVWLVIAISFYTFYPRRKAGSLKKPIQGESFQMTTKNGSIANCQKGLSTSSTSPTSSRGPRPLTKNVIDEQKMVQLRKKSLDYLEVQRHMMELNRTLDLKHQLNNPPSTSDGDEEIKKERRDSKPDQDQASSDDLDDSRAPLHQSSPELEDPFPSLDRNQHCHSRTKSSTSSDADDDEDDEDEEDEDDQFNSYIQLNDTVESVQSPSSLARASTFNYGTKVPSSTPEIRETNYESDNSEKGGSLRITRHSRRARGKLDHIFNKPGIASQSSVANPSFNITPSTPPLRRANHTHQPDSEGITRIPEISCTSVPELATVTASAPVGAGVCPFTAAVVPPATTTTTTTTTTAGGATAETNTAGRRRKAALVPPLLIAPPPQQRPAFQSSLSVGASPKPCRRGVSPGSSGGEESGASPKPQRKKKVSVAQIEATVLPPTPMNLEPPAHLSLSRSPSMNTMRTHQDAFADNAFRSVMQISQDAICCANSIGDIVFWSAGACKMFGYTPGEAIGSSLEMIIPQSYKEKHRNGITNRTERTLKYIKKHSYTPEEQKHARLYAVHGVTKGGHEFPVEVNVTSFVLDGEMFYTGVISELAKTKTRNNSVSSSNDLNEIALKQRALAVGAQMKISHNLRDAEHISQRELEKVLKGSLGTNFEVDSYQMEQMIEGIMKAGDPEETGVISFVKLIQLLSSHQLYISESGIIARYGKTKRSENTSNRTRSQLVLNKMEQFILGNIFSLMWFFLYVALNLVLFAVGVGVYSTRDDLKDTWSMWAYGTGPVLSMNCILLLLPTLSSLINVMRNSTWMNRIFPLKRAALFHVIIAFGLFFWTLIHLLTHFSSFGLDQRNNTDFRTGIRKNIVPTITGFLVLIIFTVMGVSSIKPLRSLLRFIPFNLIHWIGGGLFYLLLLIHGVNYWNPSFWKWLLPAILIFVLERIYRHVVVKRVSTNVISAGRYDSVSRTAIIEIDKPKHFEYQPGQYILFNLPTVGKFQWQPCQISSSPRDEKLTIYVPFSNDIWFKKAFSHLKEHPHNMPQPGQQQRAGGREKKNARLSLELESDLVNLYPAYFTGPYGPIEDLKLLFRYKISTLVCGGDGPHAAKAVIKYFLDYRKAITCHCGCQPVLAKLYFVWVIPSGNDFEWFTDYLSDLCEDEHIHRYLDIRVFLTNCDSAPDELASALLQLGLKTAGGKVTVRRPSQPQLNNLYHMTSYGLPDFSSLLDYISSHHSSAATPLGESGVFTVGDLSYTMHRDLLAATKKSSKLGQHVFKQHRIVT